jgi:ribosomal protein S18 acetylase RimI-like enzyme
VDSLRLGEDADVEVRPAVSLDVDAIAETHVLSWRETYAGQVPQDYLDSLSVDQRRSVWTTAYADAASSSAAILVLTHNGEVVGFAHVCSSRDSDAPDGVGEVTSIYIRRTYWSLGGGQALMAEALGALARNGFAVATLWVLETNIRARRFYEANGWQVDGAEKLDTIGGVEVKELRYRRSLI